MSLNDQIKKQYSSRGTKDVLYAGKYSRLAFQERSKRMLELVSKYRTSKGSVLEIGAGHGDNVPLLRCCGFNSGEIFLNELLPERIANIKVRYPDVPLYEGDALEIDFNRTFQCVFQSTVFTSLLQENDRRKLASRMWQLLEPGGFVLWYDFIYNNPANREVRGIGITETRSLFPLAEKVEIHRVTLAPPIGRRVGMLYPLFNLPFLRSHILAVFQKPS